MVLCGLHDAVNMCFGNNMMFKETHVFPEVLVIWENLFNGRSDTRFCE